MDNNHTGLYVAYAMQVLILAYSLYSLYIGNLFWTVVAFIALFITLLPPILERRLRIALPWELNFLVVLSLYIHVGGNISGFYSGLYPFYDKAAHLVSAVTIAVLALVSSVIINRYTETRMGRHMIILFIIALTVALGALWEMGEFLSDKLLGTSFQYDIDDTMYDLLFDSAGGVLTALVGYEYLKKMPDERFRCPVK